MEPKGQPILFTKHNGNNWRRIYFDDTSVDANADISGTYQSGNILRWVNIEGAAQGIGCNNATPYLSHLTTDGGGLECFLGTTSAWLMESSYTGNVSLYGFTSHVINVEIPAGMLFLHDGEVEASTIRDTIYISFTGVVEDSLVSAGGIQINEAATVSNSMTNGGGITIWQGKIEKSTIIGGNISITSGSVFTNTISGGGIITGNGTEVQGNNIEGSSGWGISSGNGTVINNRVVGNAMGIRTSGGMIQGNLVANSNGIAIDVNGNTTIISNTLNGNSGSAIKLSSGTDIEITGNNLEGNLGTYDIENLTTADIPAQNNWWGTTDPSAISQRIYDYDDDYSLGEVVFQPVAVNPIQSAPAYLRSITLDPESPVGIETVDFLAKFSHPMDKDFIPEMVFNPPYHPTWTLYNASNSGLPTDRVYAIARDLDGSHWIGTGYDGGLVHFDGDIWTVYNSCISGLPGNIGITIKIDPNGLPWLAQKAKVWQVLMVQTGLCITPPTQGYPTTRYGQF